MWFWIFMLLCDLLMPSVMIAFGRIFLKHPPKNINSFYGYRTSRSMKNRDTWDFAHRYCGRLWFRCGLILLPLSVIPLLFVLRADVDTVGTVGMVVCLLQLLPLILSIIPTERALKRTFDRYGRRRNPV